jgi:hypothetical protein
MTPDLPRMLYQGSNGSIQKTVHLVPELVEAMKGGWRTHPDPAVADTTDEEILDQCEAFLGVSLRPEPVETPEDEGGDLSGMANDD